VLRTHTSPVQIRAHGGHGAPCRVIAPGRVYRADYDQTHTPMFHQVEGLAIDRDISMANLKWTLEEFFSAYFGTRSEPASAPRTSRSRNPRPRSTSSVPGKAAR
jgi:phenylalanyl-tRNA synthetase alpha chain